jgi:hypothetical protein
LRLLPAALALVGWYLMVPPKSGVPSSLDRSRGAGLDDGEKEMDLRYSTHQIFRLLVVFHTTTPS